MKKSLFLAVVVCLFLFAFVGDSPDVSGGQVDYVRVCDSYGAGFEYIPGLEICWNAQTGEAVAETDGGEWRSILPYPVGQWVSTPASDCKGKISHVGTFKSTDFTENSYDRGETYPVSLPLDQGSFISKVFMSGGFYAPPGPPRGGSILEANGSVDGNALCLRSKDPDVTEYKGNPPEPFNPPYGNYGLPIGCIQNSRIVGMPAAYEISAESAYPDVEITTSGEVPNLTYNSYRYGSELVVTTDFHQGTPSADQNTGNLYYTDPNTEERHPLSGSVSVDVCVVHGGQVPNGGGKP